MYARNLSFHVKPASVVLFNEKIQKDVLPLLRKQSGFKNQVMFSDTEGTHVTSISLWDTEASAKQYATGAYDQVLTLLGDTIDSAPKLVVGSSTIYSPVS